MTKLLLIISLLFSSSFAGWKWEATKVGATIGAVKAYKVYKAKNKKIFTKKLVNGRTTYQREIDPSLVVTKKKRAGKIETLTNLERMKNGKTPHVKKKDGSGTEQVELHHSRQNDKGSLFELKKSTHSIKNKDKGGNALHPYGDKKHPYNPVPKERKLFNKEKIVYWQERYKQELNRISKEFDDYKNNKELK